MRKLLADTSISNNPKILEELKKAGWKTPQLIVRKKELVVINLVFYTDLKTHPLFNHQTIQYASLINKLRITPQKKPQRIRLLRRVQT